MFNYKYTVAVSSWSDDIENYISQMVKHYQVEFSLEKSFHDDNLIIFNFKGEKENLDQLEFKLSKNFSELVKYDGFSKTTTEITPEILNESDIIDMDECEFSLSSSKKISNSPLQDSIKLLKSQNLGLIKNTNGYYLVCICSKSKPVKKLREIIKEPTKSLPILAKNILQLEKFARVSKKEIELLTSKAKPFVRVTKKPIHRLEKIKNIPINSIAPLNNYEVKLPKNPLEEYLVYETNIPLIFVKVENIYSLYKEVDFILSFEKNFLNVDDSILQTVYGKQEVIRYGLGLQKLSIKLPKKSEKTYIYDGSGSVALLKEDEIILARSGIKTNDFTLLCEANTPTHIENECKHPTALIHSYTSGYDEAIVFEFETDRASILRYSDKKLQKLYEFKHPLEYYFDSCAIDANLLKDINYQRESQIACNNSFEICHEKSFDIIIDGDFIDIDIANDLKDEETGSALINSFTKLTKIVYEKYELPIVLCGELFENKNITENIIEYFDDNDIEFYISQTIPINKSASALGVILDFYLKNC